MVADHTPLTKLYKNHLVWSRHNMRITLYLVVRFLKSSMEKSDWLDMAKNYLQINIYNTVKNETITNRLTLHLNKICMITVLYQWPICWLLEVKFAAILWGNLSWCEMNDWFTTDAERTFNFNAPTAAVVTIAKRHIPIRRSTKKGHVGM